MTTPADLASVIATISAVFPLTPARAAANAALLDENVALYEEAHPELSSATERNELDRIS